ncbi:MAG: hypothetical protein H6510_06255 [Acidobacteria bacterium]|nr:hypothetical protein [Acidobacteriota bacterium]MCB9397397.1 hypothetical protein [Acidobacteriota bacterium]
MNKHIHFLILTELKSPADLPYFRMARSLARCLTAKGFSCLFVSSRDSHPLLVRFQIPPEQLAKAPNDNQRFLERIGELHRQHRFRAAAAFFRPESNPTPIASLKPLFPFLLETQFEAHGKACGHLVLFPAFHATLPWLDVDPASKIIRGPKAAIISETGGLPPSPNDQLLVWLTHPAKAHSPLAHLLQQLSNHFTVTQICDTQMLEQQRDLSPHPQNWPYSLVLSDAHPRCLELAAWGKPFLHFPQNEQQLTASYGMDQLGVAPSLGLLEAHPTEVHLQKILAHRQSRSWTPFVLKAKRICDGKGFNRIFPILLEGNILSGFGPNKETP